MFYHYKYCYHAVAFASAQWLKCMAACSHLSQCNGNAEKLMAISLDSLGMLIGERVNLTLAGHETRAREPS